LLVGSVSASAVRVAVALTSNTLAETSALQTAVMVRVPPLATDPSSQTTRVALVAAQLRERIAARQSTETLPASAPQPDDDRTGSAQPGSATAVRGDR
jgi:hypothetical protein